MLTKINFQERCNHMVLGNYTIRQPRGHVIEIYINPLNSLHDRNDRVQIKQRARQIKQYYRIPKNIPEYTIVGRCLRFKKRGLDTTIWLRNVITLVPFEMIFPIFSPVLEGYRLRDAVNKDPRYTYKRATHYEYRKYAASRVHVPFKYYGETSNTIQKII